MGDGETHGIKQATGLHEEKKKKKKKKKKEKKKKKKNKKWEMLPYHVRERFDSEDKEYCVSLRKVVSTSKTAAYHTTKPQHRQSPS